MEWLVASRRKFYSDFCGIHFVIGETNYVHVINIVMRQ